MGTENPETAHEVDSVEHRWITMPDGVRLAARLWLPRNTGPVPAILEYIPYRRRDMVRARDERNHPFFAAHGYACLRVDMRGSGDSEGHMPDMYAPDELADARHVIAWIAEQDWCNGRVGMFGTSWGGTASLQAAVDAPEPLKAVIANCATIDRFEDDIHWMGGCLLTDSFEWGATLPAILAAPPDAATVGPGWRDIWDARLGKLAFPLEHWVRHDVRGDYWRNGSVRFQLKNLSIPVLSIGGWSDRYSNSVLRLVTARPDLSHGIVGPWGHQYPDQGEPGPAASFQHIALDWWDRWLKNKTKPALPGLQVWERNHDIPAERLTRRNGRWIAFDADVTKTMSEFHLGAEGLTTTPDTCCTIEVSTDLKHGAQAGDTGYFGRVGGLPLDQTDDDAKAMCCDSAALTEEKRLVGHATLICDVPDDATGQLVLRLCDVAPDGTSNLVTRAIINLALDEDLDCRTHAPTSNGYRRRRIEFPATAYRFAKSHRLRLSLSRSYWPLVWPDFGDDAQTIKLRNAKLELPCPTNFVTAADLPPAQQFPEAPNWEITSQGALRREQVETESGRQDRWVSPPTSVHFLTEDLTFTSETHMDYRLNLQAPQSVGLDVSVTYEIDRKDGCARIASVLHATSDANGLTVSAELEARWDGQVVSKKAWRNTFPND